MFGVSPTEMVVLMLVALLVYGGDLPKVARSWGKSISEFKRGLASVQNEFNNVMYDEPRHIPYHDPVYSHNAGTIDGHLADEMSQSPEELASRDSEATEAGSATST
jgi:sec-independent protein translocase protein TatA